MEFTFLGSGNYFTTANFHSNILVRHNDQGLLIDAGSDLKRSLPAAGFTCKDVDTVYISHLHDDHVGGLEWLGFIRHFLGLPKPKLFLHQEIFQYLWPCKLAVGMDKLKTGPMKLDDYFDVNVVEDDFFFGDVFFRLVRVPHIMDSFGLFIPERMWFTSDCAKVRADLCEQAKIIFHDCEMHDPASGAHTQFDDLLDLPDQIKSKIWLYHLHDVGEIEQVVHRNLARYHGFAGIIPCGETFIV